MRSVKYIFFLFSLYLLQGCTEDYELTEMPPSVEDAAITVSEQTGEANTFLFSNNSDAFIKVWDFSTGQQKKGDQVSLYVPFEGSYSVKLTIYNAGGSVTKEDQFTVNQTDPGICNDEVLALLTGGCDATDGKTWVVDSAKAAHFGLGPVDAAGPIWYAAGAMEKKGGGMYDDRYTFFLNDYRYNMETKGEVYLNGGQTGDFPGAFSSPVGDFTAPYEAPENLNYSLETGSGNPVLTISNGGFLGYYTGVRTYEILELTEDVLYVKYLDTKNDFSWFMRFIREGYDSNAGGGGNEPDPVNLPVTFETVEPPFTTFGNSSYEVVDNPDQSGINTSSRVGKTVHGNETWAGLFVDLGEALDFSTNPMLAVKVWAPVTGEFQFKLEEIGNSGNFIELKQNVEVANQWVDLVFDFSSAPENLNRVVLFPGWGSGDAETFYFDDIRVYEPPVNLPINFETMEPSFTTFGGSSYSVVDNPDKTGLNTSNRVGQTVHGNESWAGLFVELDQNLTLSSNPKISIKVWSPITTDIIMKLENLADNNLNTELTKQITTANEWVELVFDFTGQPDSFGRLVIFPGFGTTEANTFYFDDIQFVQ